jgi:hypothetical protein
MSAQRSHVDTIRPLYAMQEQPSVAAAFALLAEDVELIAPGPPGLGAAGTFEFEGDRLLRRVDFFDAAAVQRSDDPQAG